MNSPSGRSTRIVKARVLVLFLLFAGTVTLPAATPFDYDLLCRRAAEVAARPYVDDTPELTRALRELDYDQLRSIRFDPARALWRMERLPFQLQFFHPGGLQRDGIRMNWVEGEVQHAVPFDSDLFDYTRLNVGLAVPDRVAFAGFRVHYPLNRPDYLDELIVFQGASYFRALGEGLRYGLSARGVAVNVSTKATEEFPRFREFWMVKPDRTAKQLRFYALLDGPSLAGAYEFTVTPGRATIVEVRATLILRRAVEMLGLAPLTSMFLHGENSALRHGDFRPEVHDSDGLLLHTGSGEWLWRPLDNESRLRYASFVDRQPRGFGLLQRDRKFTSFEDLEANYHLRPSVWIEPLSEWGEGEIRLIEIPTGSEYNDNVVACWVPRTLPAAGKPLSFAYRMQWYAESPTLPPLGRVAATRLAQIPYLPGAAKFVLDFGDSPALAAAAAESLQADVSAANGTILGQTMMRNDYGKSWRVVFDVKPVNDAQPVELRCFIKTAEKPLTETWTYLWLR